MPQYPQMHVKRIPSASDPNVSIDMLRVDVWRTISPNSPDQGANQGIVWYLKWLDGYFPSDPQPPAENQNPVRQTHTLTLYNPKDGPMSPPPSSGDPGTVDLTINDRMTTVSSGFWTGRMGEAAKRYFKNYMASQTTDPTEYTTARTVVAMRVVNNDLGGLDMTNPVDWTHTYLPALMAGKQDSTQYIDVEVVGLYKTFQNPGYSADFSTSPVQPPPPSSPGGPPQTARTAFFGGNATRKAFGADTLATLAGIFSESPSGADPVFRTDPYQVPVNIHWGGGPATFIAVDQGSNAFSNANITPTFDQTLWPNPQRNYPGGWNLWQSSDGKSWTHTSQGIVDSNPSAYQATTYDATAGLSWIGTVTLYLTELGSPIFQTSYVGVISGESPLPADIPAGYLGMGNGSGWLVGTPTVTSPHYVYPLWTQNGSVPDLFTYGNPYQPSAFLTDYGLWDGTPSTTVADVASWGETNEVQTNFLAWNFTSGTISALDGIMEFVTSSSDPIQVFVIGFNGYSGGFPPYGVPLYYRSVSGGAWELFTPPIAPSTPWFPSPSDCFFDDGTQRTTTDDGHGNLTFDGAPTYLWYSFASYSGPLYESNDGTHTWTLSSRLPGNNPSTNKTDDHYVGDPDNEPFYGEMGTTRSGTSVPAGPANTKWTRVFGEVTATGHKMGVQIIGDPVGGGFPTVIAGPADQDPSTWSEVTLPTPPNVTTVVDYVSALDLVTWNIENLDNLNDQLTMVQNQIDAFEACVAFCAANPSYPFAEFFTYAAGTTLPLLLDGIEAKIAALPSPPGPRTYALNPLYIAYGVPPGSHIGIFVMCGDFTTIPDPSLGEANSGNAGPLFWWSEDAVTWHVANYDYDFAGDGTGTRTLALEYMVSGNPAPQLYPTAPAP